MNTYAWVSLALVAAWVISAAIFFLVRRKSAAKKDESTDIYPLW